MKNIDNIQKNITYYYYYCYLSDNDITLFKLIYTGNVNLVRDFIKFHNYNFLKYDIYNINGDTPLIVSIHNNDYEMVKMLLFQNCNTETKNILGESPLIIAINLNFFEIVKILLYNYCDVNAINNDGETALFIAIKKNLINIVTILLNNNAHVYCLNYNGKFPKDYILNDTIMDLVLEKEYYIYNSIYVTNIHTHINLYQLYNFEKNQHNNYMYNNNNINRELYKPTIYYNISKGIIILIILYIIMKSVNKI